MSRAPQPRQEEPERILHLREQPQPEVREVAQQGLTGISRRHSLKRLSSRSAPTGSGIYDIVLRCGDPIRARIHPRCRTGRSKSIRPGAGSLDIVSVNEWFGGPVYLAGGPGSSKLCVVVKIGGPSGTGFAQIRDARWPRCKPVPAPCRRHTGGSFDAAPVASPSRARHPPCYDLPRTY